MRVLALDTTTRAGSVALVEDDRVLATREGDPSRSQAERLPTELVDLLTSAALPMPAIDVYAVAAGPGSFTGLRIGIATIQGLAFVTGRPVAAVSALAAHAQLAAVDLPSGTVVGAWIDASRRDVYSALYRVADAAPYSPERLVELDPAAVGDPADTVSRWHAYGSIAVMAGGGAVTYGHFLPASVRVVETRALAAAIGRMAIELGRRGLTINPAAVQPLYIRRPDVEIERDRRSGNGTAASAAAARGPAGER